MFRLQLPLVLLVLQIVSCAWAVSIEETDQLANSTAAIESQGYPIQFVEGSEADQHFVSQPQNEKKGLRERLLKRWHRSFSSHIEMNFQSSSSFSFSGSGRSSSSHYWRSSSSHTSYSSSSHDSEPGHPTSSHNPQFPSLECGGLCQVPSLVVFLTNPSVCFSAQCGGGCYYHRVRQIAAFQAPLSLFGQVQRIDCELAQARCTHGYGGQFVPQNSCTPFL